ncbi:RNA polymerase, sigma 28 subunit, SigD/FliA/WhiG [Bryocella elongata]|uniref:RNA polymerase, sigma 28 subunit, SigD/FliA/WhiG n=2 Tax=Bryocella elongata TaxID=863522 RepID=A0A1H5TL69_9BACT|nr:RNA polymerase, sigma 28 subunit, SigD/FliA/WhiG [Bryocella elongata]
MTAAEIAYRSTATVDEFDERNELVMKELPQVYYIAARIRERLPQHVEMEDLVNAGVLGLIEATRNFDSAKNAGFSTFAKFRIRGAILDSLRKLDWGSRTLRRKGRAISASIASLASKLSRQPTHEEIAADLNMELSELQNTMTELDGLYLVGQQSDSDGDSSVSYDLIESAPSRGGDNPFELCLEGEMKEQLAKAIGQLSEREQLILSLYYEGEATMKEIAEIVGVVVSRVSQIHSGALMKLRAAMQHLNEKPEAKKEVERPAAVRATEKSMPRAIKTRPAMPASWARATAAASARRLA